MIDVQNEAFDAIENSSIDSNSSGMLQNALGFIDQNRIDIKLAGTCHSSGFPGL